MEDKPLMDSSESNKRPTILYIIIGVLIAIIIVLIIVIVAKKCDECKCNCSEPSPYNPEHFIPVKESFYPKTINGSRAYQGKLNHFDSPYFKMADIYNMESNSNRTILSKFKTYEQTSEYSAQCAAVIMTLEYYGDEAPSERQCMKDFAGVTDPDNFEDTNEFYQKLTMKNLENYINSLGYTTTSNDNYTAENFPFSDSPSFSVWVREILKKNETIIINWADWGGSCPVIIGVDNMGNGSPLAGDHVIILADSYDTCDHLNDGYYTIGLEKFYYNWNYAKIPYFNPENEKYAAGRFIIIHRKNGN